MTEPVTLQILVVEDNPADSDFIHELLPTGGPVGFHLVSVTRLSDALTRLQCHDLDLVLLDLSLPDSQGLPTFHQLRQAAPDLPVIVLTGTDDQELAVAAVRDGAQDFLVKGQFNGSLLTRAIRYAIERQQTEEKLRQSEAKFKAMVDTIPLAIHLTSGSDHLTEYINPAMVSWFGYTLEELPTIRQWWPLAYPDEPYRRQIAEEWSHRVQQAVQTQVPIEPMEVVVTCKDGSKKNIAWGYITLGDKNYACGLDLTKRKQAETALRETLHENQTLLKEIHYRVNHNLQIICSLLRLPTSLIDQPVAATALRDMQNRVRSIALVHEHLYRSTSLAHLDLAAYIRSLAQQLFTSLVPAPATIQLQLELAPVRLTMDQAIPFGLLINELISNALTHAFPGGLPGTLRIDLESVAGGREMRLRIADNGVGLPPGFDLKQLTSLGLPLASDLACQLGGRMQLGSGPGAVFEVLFRESRI